jgi:2OG-Fe(II) oxygenase superfamily
MPTEAASSDQQVQLDPETATTVHHVRPVRRGRRGWACVRTTRVVECVPTKARVCLRARTVTRGVSGDAQEDAGSSPFFFEPSVLLPVAASNSKAFAEAVPFQHAVLDGLLPADLLHEILNEVPDPKDESWTPFENTKSHKKFAIAEDWLLGPNTRHLMSQLNSAAFIEFLEKLTGVQGLIPDPHHLGGGLQQIGSGGFLKIHTDFPFHKVWKLNRRVNVLLYLNQDWDEAWGGDFELWNEEMTSHRSVAPLFNRMVVFSTPNAKHGHPDPLLCPEDTFRRALVVHYYTNGSEEPEMSDPRRRHYERPGEVFEAETPKHRKRQSDMQPSRLRDLLPPILMRGVSRLQSLRVRLA